MNRDHTNLLTRAHACSACDTAHQWGRSVTCIHTLYSLTKVQDLCLPQTRSDVPFRHPGDLQDNSQIAELMILRTATYREPALHLEDTQQRGREGNEGP